jgi:hypothetical protein
MPSTHPAVILLGAAFCPEPTRRAILAEIDDLEGAQ